MPYIQSEDDFLGLINRYFSNSHPRLILGRGDDCAELDCPPRMAVSTDLFLEHTHFRQSYFLPQDIGHKALAINLSDLAAAGAAPVAASAGLMVPVPFPRATAEGIIEGMAALAAQHALALSGGDLARSALLGFCLTVFGEPCRADAPFLRRGPVRPGYVLFTCGNLGMARVGLTLLEQAGRAAIQDYPQACAAHLRPTPLVAEGQALTAIPGCCLMDVSDGLARDLPRLLGRYGATLALEAGQLHPELRQYAARTGADPVRTAFSGGEEYALLGACPAEAFPQVRDLLPQHTPFVRLGEVTHNPALVLNGRTVDVTGFDHFSR